MIDPTETHYGDDWEDSMEAVNYRDELRAAETDEPERVCLFPGRCCMPGDHLPSECHTSEMMERWNDL